MNAPHRRPARAALIGGWLLVALGQVGCITETESGLRTASGMQTAGVIVQGSTDVVWERVRMVLESMSGTPLESRGLDRSVVTTVRGSEVRVLVERHGPSTTAIHVTSDDADLADAIRMRVMR